jgi:ATP-dependent exoDNAse (exonuclease V) alpha subunit
MTRKNLCFSNAKRIQINEEVNGYFLRDAMRKQESTVFIPKGTNKLCQPMHLYVGTPLMAIKTVRREKKLCYTNGQKFNLVSWYKATSPSTPPGLFGLEIDTEWDPNSTRPKPAPKIISVSFAELQEKFVLAYCITVHKSQCSTIFDKYTIHEFDKMGKKMQYTALSRTTDAKKIVIVRDDTRCIIDGL